MWLHMINNLLKNLDLNMVCNIGYYDRVLAKKKKSLNIKNFDTTNKQMDHLNYFFFKIENDLKTKNSEFIFK